MLARFLWHLPYLERVEGVLDGVQRGPVGPPRPIGGAMLSLVGVGALDLKP